MPGEANRQQMMIKGLPGMGISRTKNSRLRLQGAQGHVRKTDKCTDSVQSTEHWENTEKGFLEQTGVRGRCRKEGKMVLLAAVPLWHHLHPREGKMIQKGLKSISLA